MNPIPVVITNSFNNTRVVLGYPVQIGSLTGVFAATIPTAIFDDGFVITHLATGLAVPGSERKTIEEAVKAAEHTICKLGKEKYERKVQEAIDQVGPHIAARYAAEKERL